MTSSTVTFFSGTMHHGRSSDTGVIICIRSVPFLRVRIQITLHEPGTRRIVDMIRIVMASESISRIQLAVLWTDPDDTSG